MCFVDGKNKVFVCSTAAGFEPGTKEKIPNIEEILADDQK